MTSAPCQHLYTSWRSSRPSTCGAITKSPALFSPLKGKKMTRRQRSGTVPGPQRTGLKGRSPGGANSSASTPPCRPCSPSHRCRGRIRPQLSFPPEARPPLIGHKLEMLLLLSRIEPGWTTSFSRNPSARAAVRRGMQTWRCAQPGRFHTLWTTAMTRAKSEPAFLQRASTAMARSTAFMTLCPPCPSTLTTTTMTPRWKPASVPTTPTTTEMASLPWTGTPGCWTTHTPSLHTRKSPRNQRTPVWAASQRPPIAL